MRDIEIYNLFVKGKSLQEIALSTGISKHHIDRAVTRQIGLEGERIRKHRNTLRGAIGIYLGAKVEAEHKNEFRYGFIPDYSVETWKYQIPIVIEKETTLQSKLNR
jgi:hypothetical protein